MSLQHRVIVTYGEAPFLWYVTVADRPEWYVASGFETSRAAWDYVERHYPDSGLKALGQRISQSGYGG